MKILYATSEAVPFCKTGGLADVAGSLPPALAKEGVETAVVLPLYESVKETWGDKLTYIAYDYVQLGWRSAYCGIFSYEQDGVTWYFLDNEQYFRRADLYGYGDDGERFGFFSRAVLKMLPFMTFWPDVIHCNDWQTAMIPVFIEDAAVTDERFAKMRTVLSIHNIEYQGLCLPDACDELFGLNEGWVNDGTLIMSGMLNMLKGGILCADAVNAVSPSYALELRQPYFAHRMDPIMRMVEDKLTGVLNGIDTERYDPATDTQIMHTFSSADLSGKAIDKATLQKRMGLVEDPSVPVIAMVSRLVAHKGLDLVCEAVHDLMRLPVQLVILGKGDREYEDFFTWVAQQYKGRIGVQIGYDEQLSRAIYAGADLFLMPSRSEPCGLSQMIAMRYGTIPVVRETGGLRDSVIPYNRVDDTGTGFSFANYDAGEMVEVIDMAVKLYREEPEAFARLQQRAMAADFSWSRSALAYRDIYYSISVSASDAAEVLAAAPEEPAPKKRTRKPRTALPEEAPVKRPRRKKAESAPEEAAPAAAEAEEAPKKRTRKAKAAEPDAAAASADETPKKRTRKTKADAAAEAEAAVKTEETPKKRSRKAKTDEVSPDASAPKTRSASRKKKGPAPDAEK